MRFPKILLAFGILAACSTTKATPDAAAPGFTHALLTCGNDACWTPTEGQVVGTWEKWRIERRFDVPARWKLVGPANAVFVGFNVHDVETTAWNASSLTCNWHTEGSFQVFGPGGSVSGYCIVKARYQWLDCAPDKPC